MEGWMAGNLKIKLCGKETSLGDRLDDQRIRDWNGVSTTGYECMEVCNACLNTNVYFE